MDEAETSARTLPRHHGLDWLRIAAFGLLIFYHIGMFFVPWDWHVKTAEPIDWVALPMLATNAWRLMLLFVVSGYASRAILMRGSSSAAFARERSARLALPTIFAAAIIIPPQLWVELVEKHGYARDYLTFWTGDYFRFGVLDGLFLPTWQHLWFVVYIWAYTMLLAALPAIARAQPLFDRALRGWGLIVLPIAWLLLVRLLLVRGIGESHNFFTDATAHLLYLPAFLFGFALARSNATWATIRRLWPIAAALSVIAYATVAAFELRWPGDAVPPDPWIDVLRTARIVQGWCAIVALLGVADRWWNHDHKWRATLTEAVFPFYIIHQTTIVVVGWAIREQALGPVAEFLILVAATLASCLIFYFGGREIGWLRPWIGLRPRVARQQVPARAVAGE